MIGIQTDILLYSTSVRTSVFTHVYKISRKNWKLYTVSEGSRDELCNCACGWIGWWYLGSKTDWTIRWCPSSLSWRWGGSARRVPSLTPSYRTPSTGGLYITPGSQAKQVFVLYWKVELVCFSLVGINYKSLKKEEEKILFDCQFQHLNDNFG